MIDPVEFVDCLRGNGVEFVTGVPDSLLKELCACITHSSQAGRHIIAANEGGAIALALGYHLATSQIPLVYLQNSGLGNIVNPLLSLSDPEVYSIPMLLVVGWRGEPDIHDEPQHVKQGRVMLPMLEAMEIPFLVLTPEMTDPGAAIREAVATVQRTAGPYALVVKKDTFKPYAMPSLPESGFELSREEAICRVIDILDEDDIVISTTGMPSREVFEHRKGKGTGHHRDFLTVGGMGHASQIALGIALQKPQRSIYCLDGDGALLMHLGSLAITGSLKPRNFKHIVLNNGAHDSVGGQPTVGLDIDVLGIARAAGYTNVFLAETRQELDSTLLGLKQSVGPSLLEIRVRRGARKNLGRPTTTPIQNKQAFMDFLGDRS